MKTTNVLDYKNLTEKDLPIILKINTNLKNNLVRDLNMELLATNDLKSMYEDNGIVWNIPILEKIALKQWDDVEQALLSYIPSGSIENIIADLKEQQALAFSVYHSVERIDFEKMEIKPNVLNEFLTDFAKVINTVEGLELYKQHRIVAEEMQKLLNLTKKRDARTAWTLGENINHKTMVFQEGLSYKREKVILNVIDYDNRAIR